MNQNMNQNQFYDPRIMPLVKAVSRRWRENDDKRYIRGEHPSEEYHKYAEIILHPCAHDYYSQDRCASFLNLFRAMTSNEEYDIIVKSAGIFGEKQTIKQISQDWQIGTYACNSHWSVAWHRLMAGKEFQYWFYLTCTPKFKRELAKATKYFASKDTTKEVISLKEQLESYKKDFKESLVLHAKHIVSEDDYRFDVELGQFGRDTVKRIEEYKEECERIETRIFEIYKSGRDYELWVMGKELLETIDLYNSDEELRSRLQPLMEGIEEDDKIDVLGVSVESLHALYNARILTVQKLYDSLENLMKYRGIDKRRYGEIITKLQEYEAKHN